MGESQFAPQGLASLLALTTWAAAVRAGQTAVGCRDERIAGLAGKMGDSH